VTAASRLGSEAQFRNLASSVATFIQTTRPRMPAAAPPFEQTVTFVPVAALVAAGAGAVQPPLYIVHSVNGESLTKCNEGRLNDCATHGWLSRSAAASYVCFCKMENE
jgi:hypothetical protein